MTSHVDGDADQELLSDMGGNGFPHLVVIDSEGRLAAEHNGDRTAEAFSETLTEANGFADLRKKAAGGDAAAMQEVFEKDLKYGNVKSAEGRAAVAKMKDLTAEKKAELEGQLVDLEVKETMGEFGKKAKDVPQDDKAAGKKVQAEFGRKFLAMKKAGHIPESEEAMQPFWIFILEAAEEAKDAAQYEEALTKLKDKFGDNPQAKKFFDERDETLKKLQGGAKK